MNFMRLESWAGGWALRRLGASIASVRFSTPHRQGDLLMQWQTPTATDLRFGFEITLYVAAR
jgi:coenzyme PQQ precursor peptide PqqA